MTNRDGLRAQTCALALLCLLLCATCAGFEDVNMSTALSVESGHVVVHWNAPGFDYYNVRWSINGGVVQQVKRDGNKNFLYLPAYEAGSIYRVAVEGCEKHFAAEARCTQWEEATCGAAREPCDGVLPRPIVNDGG